MAAAGTVYFAWPVYNDSRAERIAAALEDAYGIVVRYGSPSEFFVPPHKPAEDPFHIEGAPATAVVPVLEGVGAALGLYPEYLVRENLHAVFVTGPLALLDTPASGSFLFEHRWIYVSATATLTPGEAAATVHHEFSSLLFYAHEFPRSSWSGINEPDFDYLQIYEDIIRAAGQGPDEATPGWHSRGFVSHFGMSSLENDFNTFAELAFTDPQRMRELGERHPRVAAKTRLLISFYTDLAPELGEYFKTYNLVQ